MEAGKELLNQPETNSSAHTLLRFPLSHIFITPFSTEEEAKHIKGFFLNNGPFGGSMEVLRHLYTMHKCHIPFTWTLIKHITQLLACVHWMLPHENQDGKDEHFFSHSSSPSPSLPENKPALPNARHEQSLDNDSPAHRRTITEASGHALHIFFSYIRKPRPASSSKKSRVSSALGHAHPSVQAAFPPSPSSLCLSSQLSPSLPPPLLPILPSLLLLPTTVPTSLLLSDFPLLPISLPSFLGSVESLSQLDRVVLVPPSSPLSSRSLRGLPPTSPIPQVQIEEGLGESAASHFLSYAPSPSRLHSIFGCFRCSPLSPPSPSTTSTHSALHSPSFPPTLLPPLAAREVRARPSPLSTLSLPLLLPASSPRDAHTNTQPSPHTSSPSPPTPPAAIGTPHDSLPCSQTARSRPPLPSQPPTPATPSHSPPLPSLAWSLPSSLPPLRWCPSDTTIGSSLPPSTRTALARSPLSIRSRKFSISAVLSLRSQPRSIPSRPHPRLCSLPPSPTSSLPLLTPNCSSLPLSSPSPCSPSQTPKSLVDPDRLPHAQSTRPILLPLSSPSDSLAEASSTTSEQHPTPPPPTRSTQQTVADATPATESQPSPQQASALFPNRPPSFLRPTPLKHSVVEPTHKHQQRPQAPSAPFQRVSRQPPTRPAVRPYPQTEQIPHRRRPPRDPPSPLLLSPAHPPFLLSRQPFLRAHCQPCRCLHDRDQQFSNNLSETHKNAKIRENRKNDKETERTTKTQNSPPPNTPHFEPQYSPTSRSDLPSSSSARLSLPTTQPDEATQHATLLSLRLPLFRLHSSSFLLVVGQRHAAVVFQF
ncbi:hypothetical protein BLNAU_2999 [Blattamonas nauphoetae]|uniref:Uncharacterized protein n=1 Tax=Blattamonas nauphoetae TaxID=2049346 RepID=A0ABQ9YE28_9EUKA|nr:hypothetical protein BLNAU_2999 [Blattamonas nauphoetae]